MTAQKDEQLTKRVDFVAKDDAEQIAAGIVMVPDKVDLQRDFAREETIRTFADQFETFEQAGEAGGGIQHAAWPDGWMSLERNEVLDEAETIGSTEAPAGAWIQEWRFENDQLWSLVADGILEGYSIGARDVSWGGPYAQDADAVDDVEVPDQLAEGEIWELTDGLIREVSAVDIPAVPDAQILETKADAEKRLGDHLGNRDGFIEEAMERGHSEGDAERLWDVLTEAVNAEGADQPGKQSMFAKAGRAFLSVLTGSDDGADEKTSPEAPEKEGRTLSKQNRESLFATIDASLDVLEDAGVDHGMQRFTDNEKWGFDLSEHSARTWSNPDDEDDDEDEEDDKHAAGGDTPADTDSMSDDDTNEPPEWAQELKEQIDEQSKRIDEALDDEQKSDDAFEDVPEWAKSLKEDVDKQAERIDAISKQTGATDSQQLGGAEKNGDEEGLNERQKFFIPESKRRA